MLALGPFSSPTFSSATAVGLCINLGFYGELFVMILYLQELRGFTWRAEPDHGRLAPGT